MFYSAKGLVDLSEGIDVNKTIASHEWFICNY